MKDKINSIEFFLSIPDELLVEIASNDWESLERLCWALSIDLQLLKEGNNESFSNWRNLC